MARLHIWKDEDGDRFLEWVWSGGRLGLAQNKGEKDSWYLALKDDDGGDGSYGVLPDGLVNWDRVNSWLEE